MERCGKRGRKKEIAKETRQRQDKLWYKVGKEEGMNTTPFL